MLLCMLGRLLGRFACIQELFSFSYQVTADLPHCISFKLIDKGFISGSNSLQRWKSKSLLRAKYLKESTIPSFGTVQQQNKDFLVGGFKLAHAVDLRGLPFRDSTKKGKKKI